MKTQAIRAKVQIQPPKPPCKVEHCIRDASGYKGRGLCRICYNIADDLVRRQVKGPDGQVVTWEKLVEEGKCNPVYTATDFFLSAVVKPKPVREVTILAGPSQRDEIREIRELLGTLAAKLEAMQTV